MDQRSGDRRFGGRFEIIALNSELYSLNEDRFHRGRQIAYMIYNYFRVIGAHDTVLDYADLLTITLCSDDVQEWDEILLSTTKIPSDDILEGLYKLRIRVSDQLKTVLDFFL